MYSPALTVLRTDAPFLCVTWLSWRSRCTVTAPGYIGRPQGAASRCASRVGRDSTARKPLSAPASSTCAQLTVNEGSYHALSNPNC